MSYLIIYKSIQINNVTTNKLTYSRLQKCRQKIHCRRNICHAYLVFIVHLLIRISLRPDVYGRSLDKTLVADTCGRTEFLFKIFMLQVRQSTDT